MGSLADRLLIKTAPWLASGIIRWLNGRIRPEFIGDQPLQKLWSTGEHVILSFWHDQLLLMVKGYRGPAAKVLISASKDGELIARTMGYFQVGAVRGSSNRGGRAAFRELVALGKEPFDLCFTPDGPKGPRHQVKDGVVQLARLSGRPIVPMAFSCSKGHRFSSWDRFLLPYPSARGVYSFGEPLYYGKDDTPEGFRCKVQRAMEENNRLADEYLKNYDLSSV
jgi:lysophospholipid acyltransferase (LPLAT)-like uncharacterized protein